LLELISEKGYIFSKMRIKRNTSLLLYFQTFMIQFKSASLFKNLNTKIITYFIAFAFLPLLVFSTLGYYLNKDMLTRINHANLEALNTKYAREIRFYLERKKSVLEVVNSHLGPDLSIGDQRNRLKNIQPTWSVDFTDVQVVAKTDFIQWAKRTQINRKIGIVYRDHNENLLIGILPDQEIGNLLPGEVSPYKNRIYFMEQGVQLTIGGIMLITESDNIKQRFSLVQGEMTDRWQSHDSRSGIFIAVTRLKDHDILVLTEIDAHDFFSDLSTFRNMIILANLGFALLITILAVFYSRQITRPVNQLVQAVQAMSRGHLETPVRLKTRDELQILAHEFEQMRQKLQESYQGMEEKIETRTNELRQAQAQISHQEKMASLGLMAAGIAHEIGNPLTSISSMAQVIKRKTTDEKTAEYAASILKNIERISRIVRELVDFSKPSPHKEIETDVNEIVNSAVSIIKYDRRSKKIDFNLNLQPNLPKTVLVPDHLLQIFLNILINAVDASEGLGTKINVKTLSSNQHIQIDISDQGCGIPPENVNRIFEPFFTTKGVGKGTGLGLTVSYGLVKKLQGEIKVQSEIKKGSTFSVCLPILEELEANRK